MSASRRALTDEERDQRRAEQRELADRAVEELRSSVGGLVGSPVTGVRRTSPVEDDRRSCELPH